MVKRGCQISQKALKGNRGRTDLEWREKRLKIASCKDIIERDGQKNKEGYGKYGEA